MNWTSSSKIDSMLPISSLLEPTIFSLFMSLYSSRLYFLSNSAMMSYFFSSIFLYNSAKPSWMLLSYNSMSLSSSSFT